MHSNTTSAVPTVKEAKLCVVSYNVGGSLDGLCAGTALKTHGFNTTLLERTPVDLLHNQGAGIVAGSDNIEFFKRYDRTGKPVAVSINMRVYLKQAGEVSHEVTRQRMTSRDLSYYLLKANQDRVDSSCLHGARLPEERPTKGKVDCWCGCTVTSIEDEGSKVRVCLKKRHDDGRETKEEITADLLVGANGSSTTIRGILEPQVKLTYAGYCVIPGTLEFEATDAAREVFTERFCFFHAPSIQDLTYAIAGKGENSKPGDRLLHLV